MSSIKQKDIISDNSKQSIARSYSQMLSESVKRGIKAKREQMIELEVKRGDLEDCLREITR